MSDRDRVDPDDYIDIGLARRFNDALDEIEKLEAENKRLRDGLSYIARRGYTGASHVALELLNGKVYPADPRAALEEGGGNG